eukprot:225342-Amphidinium_carterae.1
MHKTKSLTAAQVMCPDMLSRPCVLSSQRLLPLIQENCLAWEILLLSFFVVDSSSTPPGSEEGGDSGTVGVQLVVPAVVQFNDNYLTGSLDSLLGGNTLSAQKLYQ